MTKKIVQIKNLDVNFKTPDGIFEAVKDVSFDIHRGETVALVGESGSGKSVTALSTLKLLPYPAASHSPQSSIRFEGEEILDKDEKFMRSIRGRQVGMIFQEPQSSLNPLHTIEKQIGEILRVHQGLTGKPAHARILDLLDKVGLHRLKSRFNAYPHELSGGQRQRVMIAMALANNPELLIADEPTTALDVTIQAQILELLKDLQKDLNMAVLLITHDLSIVEKMADDICVLRRGKIVEENKAANLFAKPRHEYTKKLLNSRPSGTVKPIQDNAPDFLNASGIKVHFPKQKNLFGKTTQWVKAVDDINISVKKGQTVGVVGESGSGKTTLALALLKLIGSQGKIVVAGQDISGFNRKKMRPLRSRIQVVFQDPFSSLSPRMSITEIIGEGLKIHKKALSPAQRDELVVQALEDVHMNADTRHRYPHEFSGGQRQRISIARAMVLHPELVVLDEPTSALDVSVQSEIVDLLRELQSKHTLSYMFISHDLRVVRAMAHHVLVMKDGQVVESGTAEDIFASPKKEYTKTLIDAALNLKAHNAA